MSEHDLTKPSRACSASLLVADSVLFLFPFEGIVIVHTDSKFPMREGLPEGMLSITESVTIDAMSLPDGITIDASGNDPTPNSTLDDGNMDNDGDGSRVFSINIDNDAGDFDAVTLAGLTITGGDVSGDGGGIIYEDKGDLTK